MYTHVYIYIYIYIYTHYLYTCSRSVGLRSLEKGIRARADSFRLKDNMDLG